MLMGYAPSQTQVLDVFSARDPWNGNRDTAFRVHTFYVGGVMPGYAAIDKRSRPQKFSLCSDIDKMHRGLPDALVELWLGQQVRSRRLPVLLHGLEPQIGRLDYISHRTLNPMQRGVRRWAPLVLGVFVTLLGVSELSRHRGDLAAGIGLTRRWSGAG